MIDPIDEDAEQGAIRGAYHDELRGMFRTLVDNTVADEAAARRLMVPGESALAKFARGLKVLRQCRDSAVRCLKGD